MKDARIVAVGGLSSRVAALQSGVISAFPLGFGAGTNLMAKGLVRPLNRLKPLLPKPWIDLILSSMKGFAEKKPQMVTRTIKSVFQGADFIAKNPDWAKGKLATYSKLAPGAVDEVYGLLKFSRDGRLDPKAIENVRNFLIEYKIVPKEKAPEVSGIYTNKYLP
jgi:ABC-type nitrate/sulfonate/bicarbonate transport system substrate-binding protein